MDTSLALESEREALAGLVGLVEIILSRNDVPDAAKAAIRQNHRLATAYAALARAEASSLTIAEEGRFLLDRLSEIDIPEGIAREWFGHVEPSIERFRALIATPEEP